MKKVSLMLMFLMFFVMLISACNSNATLNVVDFSAHEINLKIDVPSHHASFTDEGKMTITKGWNLFQLSSRATIENFKIDKKTIEFHTFNVQNPATHKAILETVPNFKEDYPKEGEDFNQTIIIFHSDVAGEVNFDLAYSGTYFEDVTQTSFSNQNVGREITGTIGEEGAYFSTSASYYPRGKEKMGSFAITADIPADWESIADGNSLSSEIKGDRKIQSWKNPYENDGLMFMAAPYVVKTMKAGDTDVYCYFFQEDTNLFATYLPATAGYVTMYSNMIGPYPFERFTVAENFFPTGYGMPAWTLLGQQVIRLPFIVMTSLGHEVLHNWWGNSVYVDYDRGNWCEGSTVYGADYLYKLRKSEAGAIDYRKDILKQYHSYVNEDNDFPIREFTGRHNAATRTIGYNKTMMVFHMIEEEIGTEDFFKSWRTLYAEFRGKQISFEEWVDVFGRVSGKDMSHIIPHWIDRIGAPTLAIDVVNVNTQNNSVKFKVTQTNNDVYKLKVPIQFSNNETSLDTFVTLTAKEEVFEMTLQNSYNTIALDPEFHLFRNLYPDEIEPIVASIMGNENSHYVYDKEAKDSDIFIEFGKKMIEKDIVLTSPESNERSDSYANIYFNSETLPEYLKDLVSIDGDKITILGTDYELNGHTFILTGYEEGSENPNMSVLSGDSSSLPRVGALLQHYGKYSYLVFKGPRNIAKGQWPVDSKSLTKHLTVK